MNALLLPLAVLDAYDRTNEQLYGITVFLKQTFIAQRTLDGSHCYDFRAGDYGPYSHTLYTDIQALIDNNFISTTTVSRDFPRQDITQYTITDKGTRALNTALNTPQTFDYNIESIHDCITIHASKTPFELLETIYTTDPSMFSDTHKVSLPR